ncbi:MAG: hypothetical protein KDC12_02270 [Flavobacteriales bacterium]|nr:hypothetical protein [Flavobacteriales bacterium]
MRKLLFLALICLIPTVYYTQFCIPPNNVYFNVDTYFGIYELTWSPPFGLECDILYYEIEYSYSPFTPGIGEGSDFISPVYGSSYNLFQFAEYVWIHSVCDCEGGDGLPDNGSAWVQAAVSIDNPGPPPGLDFPGPTVSVSTPEQCGETLSSNQLLEFIGIYEYDGLFTPSCVGSSRYVLWKSFVAPSTGAVEISTSDEVYSWYDTWNNMGIQVVYGSPSEVVHCVPSMSNFEPQLVQGLTPGETYSVGVWSNGFGYYWDGYLFYNILGSRVLVCEAEATAEDYGVYADATLMQLCPPDDVQPQYELGFSWGENTEVTISSVQELPCGNITFTIVVEDDEGHYASVQQEIINSDDEAPVIIGVPFDDVYVSCESIPEVEYPEVTDNCGDVFWQVEEVSDELSCSYDIVRTFTAQDGCGNTASASQVIHVSDSEPPLFTDAPEELVSLPCGTEVPPVMLEAEDNCWTASVDYAENEEVLECASQLYRVWTAVDDCANTSTFTQVIQFYDNEPPTIVGGSLDTLWVSCDSIPEMDVLEAIDNCGDVLWMTDEIAQEPSCSYDIVRIYTAQDDCGNTSSVQRVIHVADSEAPELLDTPEALLSLECGTEVQPLILDAQDNCSSVTVSYSAVEEPVECTTQITRTWTATDLCDNTSSFTQIIEFYDETAPEILCPDTLILTPEDGSSNVLMPLLSLEIETIEDACDVPITWVQDPPAGIVLAPGIHVATFSATDQCGNTSECEFVLNVDQIDGLEDRQAAFGLYPVPASDLIWIDLGVPAASLEIRVQDATGRVIDRQAVQAEDVRFQWAIDHLPNGVYTLSIFTNTNNFVGSKAFIVQR